MLTSVEGVYRNGKIELAEVPDTIIEEAQVIVTFMPPAKASKSNMTLADYGISKEQAAELRTRVSIFEDAWNAPGMEVYDSYE